MEKQTELTALRSKLFATLEGVYNLSDKNASNEDKTSIEQAEAICSVSEQIIDTFKCEIEAMRILAKCDNVKLVSDIAQNSGIVKLEAPKKD